MQVIKFFLFGHFRVESCGIPFKVEPHKAEELLVFLLLHREKPQTRERLADMLWRDISPEQSKNYFRKTLWQLQSAMEPLCGKSLLIVDSEWIQFNYRFECELDIGTFETVFKSTQGIFGASLESNQVLQIQDATDLFQSGLLEGWYQDWCIYERERLQYLYLAMLDKLMIHYVHTGCYEKGLAIGERILQFDKAHERTHRWLMRLHYLTGDRTAALRQYHKCAKVLQEELGVEPAENTRILFTNICSDKLENVFEADVTIPVPGKDPLKEIMSHLMNFQRCLVGLRIGILMLIMLRVYMTM